MVPATLGMGTVMSGKANRVKREPEGMERVDRPNIARVRRWVWLGRKDGRAYLMADPRCRDYGIGGQR